MVIDDGFDRLHNCCTAGDTVSQCDVNRKNVFDFWQKAYILPVKELEPTSRKPAVGKWSLATNQCDWVIKFLLG